MKSEDLIEKVQCYFFQDESLSKKFENFVNKNCHVIDLSNDEHKLVYTEIYNEYKDMLEETLEKYIESLGNVHYSPREIVHYSYLIYVTHRAFFIYFRLYYI